MQINPEISEVLKLHKINVDEGTLCLLGIFHKLDVDKVCSEATIAAINLTKIVEREYTLANKDKGLKWNVPLFLGQETDWEWVKTWNDRWKVNPDRKASSTDVIKRMKEFFSKYPEYRKEDVIKATDEYFKSSTTQFLKNSAAFIFDGAGAMKKSILLGWCEKVKGKSTSTNMIGKLVT